VILLFLGASMAIVGSAHCLAMCGPLALLGAGGVQARDGRTSATNAVLYHFGRLATYLLLGAIAGLAGTIVAGTGWRNVLSIVAGAGLIVSASGLARWATRGRLPRLITRLVNRFGAASRALRPGHPARAFLLGAGNGLLPCGLLYSALGAAAGLGNLQAAMTFLTGFGLGTLPAFGLLLTLAHRFTSHVPLRLRRASPIVVGLVGLLLIVRGLIPASHAHGGHSAEVTHAHMTMSQR
jgi:sulfite exporter TauE/SafE